MWGTRKRTVTSNLPPSYASNQSFLTCHRKRNLCSCDDTVRSYADLGVYWCPGMHAPHEPELLVARHYGLPIVSYRRAVWPDEQSPPADLALFWEIYGFAPTHPGRVSHEMVSDVVKFALAQLLFRPVSAETAQPPPPRIESFMELTHLVKSCATRPTAPLTLIRSDTATAPSPAPVAVQGHWEFIADSPSKFSWTGVYGGSGSPLAITFPVVFSVDPRLEIASLRSNKRYILNARVSLSGCPAGIDSHSSPTDPPHLSGYWFHIVTVPFMTTWALPVLNQSSMQPSTWRADPYAHGGGGFFSREFDGPDCKLLPGVAYNLTISVDAPSGESAKGGLDREPRFNVISITTC